MGCFNSVPRGEARSRIGALPPRLRATSSEPAPPIKLSRYVDNFSLEQLKKVTRDFSDVIGEGSSMTVYKGRLESGQVVAVKGIKREEGQEGRNPRIHVEAGILGMPRHPNLVKLIGIGGDGEIMLVYEFMPQGTLHDHLFGLSLERRPLDWNTRVKIAVGSANGLKYLHDVEKINFPNMKAANILLDNEFNPKLSGFGIRIANIGAQNPVPTRELNTVGYRAPEYFITGCVTTKTDVYSFGVVLLELITGRKAFEPSRLSGKQELVQWARPFLKDKRAHTLLADPSLENHCPKHALEMLVSVAAMCVQEKPDVRPVIQDVVSSLALMRSHPYNPVEGCKPPPASSSSARC